MQLSMEGESGCGHSSQVSQEQQGGSITNEPDLSDGSPQTRAGQSLCSAVPEP